MPATLKTVTIACKVNQYETEFVRQSLAKAGYRDALGDELRERYFRSPAGRWLQVLVEEPAEKAGRVIGTSCPYAAVELPGSAELIGKFVHALAFSRDRARILTGDGAAT